jgi:pilus assembly protein CpaC
MRNRGNKTRKSWQYLVIAITTVMSWNALAQDVDFRPPLRQGVTESMVVPLYKSGVMRLEEPAARISVGNPDVADILILRDTQLYVLGKDLGTTNVILWGRNDQLIGTVSVEVTHDLAALKGKLHELLPNDEILVHSSQRNIILSGQVSNLSAMQAALDIASGYLAQVNTSIDNVQFDQTVGSLEENTNTKASGKVINLIQIGGGQQVMLEVKVAEIARTELRSIEAQMNFISNSTRWSIGGTNGGASFQNFLDDFSPSGLSVADKGLFTSFLSDDFIFNMALNAAKENGLAKILAEPTLTTLTGQEAEFLSGGEFPIPVPDEDGGTTIEFKDFGVALKFLPVVLGDGIINLKVNISVSELKNNNAIGLGNEFTNSSFIIPALSKRSAQATYELRDGQTIGVAGLISENLREVVSKFPGLGSVPILGALFRSQDFVKGETELVIMITPRLAKPIDPKQLTLPTDSFVEPSDAEFYFLGRLEGKRNPSETRNSSEGGTDSDFGHQVQ